MRTTRRQLKRIIKEALLCEGVKEDVMAYYGEIADMHSDSDAMGDLLDDLTDADLVAAGWEGGKDEAENYEDDFGIIVDALTPETLNRLVQTMDPDDLARAHGGEGEGEVPSGRTDAYGGVWKTPQEGEPEQIFDGVPLFDEIPDNRVGNKNWVIKGTAQLAKEIFGDVAIYDLGNPGGLKIEPGSANVEALRAEWEPLWPDAQVTNNTINITSDSAYAAADKVVD